MAAPEGNQNALGNSGGKSLNDRKLAADVRTLTLKQIFKLLSTDRSEMSDWEKDLYKQVFIKLSGTVLPRLNEHTGEEGKAIEFINKINYILPNGADYTPNTKTTPSVSSPE